MMVFMASNVLPCRDQVLLNILKLNQEHIMDNAVVVHVQDCILIC